MKKILILLVVLIVVVLLAIYGGKHGMNGTDGISALNDKDKFAHAEQKTDKKFLIAYFSRAENTNFSVDVDASTSASIMVYEGKKYGATEFMAKEIQSYVGGDLFLIRSENPYPTELSKLIY